jgi:putative ABC transport system permease protein
MRLRFWRRREEEIEEEIRAHLEMARRDRMERGEAAREAEEASRREFGNVGLVQELSREQWGWGWPGELARDLRLGWRALRRTPGFTAAAVTSLALGLALSMTTFAVVNAYLLRAMPYPAARRLFHVMYAPMGQPEPRGTTLADWKGLGDVVEVADNSAPARLFLNEGGYPQEAMGLAAAPGSLEALGVRAVIGRPLLDEDYRSDADRVAMIGYALWRERFGADPNVVGRHFRATPNNLAEPAESYRIVGVLPPEFRFAREYSRGPMEFAVPLRAPLRVYLVRLREGAPVAFAERRITDMVRAAATSLPPNWTGMRLESTHERYVKELRPTLVAITVAAALALVIVCVNVAVLVLLRAMRRQKEMAVRVALGAGRKHIARMLMAESFLLCGAALAAGLALTGVALRLLAPVVEERLGRGAPGGAAAIAIDPRVLLIAGGTGVAIALSLSFVPLLTPWRSRLAETLQREGRGGTDGRGMRRLRSSLIVLEIAASMALLVGCGLMIRTVLNLTRTDLGVKTERLARVRVALPNRTYPDDASFLPFYDRLRERLRSTSNSPFALTNFIPFYETPKQALEIDDGAGKGNANGLTGGLLAVSENYFEMFGVNIKQGRGFTAADRAGAEPVAIISETLARRLWPNDWAAGGAVGRRIRTADQPVPGSPLTVWRTIVGVARDVRQTYTDSDQNDIYIPFFQSPSRHAPLYFRTDRFGASGLEALRAEVARIDPQVLISGEISLDREAAKLLAGPRFLMAILTGFAVFAALLATLGVYGVTAYAVQQREREVAIRAAIGASPAAIVRMFLKEGGIVLTAGIGFGLLAAVAVARTLESQLHGVRSYDLLTLLGACAFLAAAGALAIWSPAKRAATRNPVSALNGD